MNKDKPIIVICGLATHGKSTAAKILKDFCVGSKLEVIPFAKALKEIAMRLGWDGVKDKKGRIILQHLGTEVCRNIDDDYWVKRWGEAVDKAFENGADVVLCDDLRFYNEMEEAKRRGAYFIKIKKRMSWFSKLIRKIKLKLGLVHASEICFNDNEAFFDLVINNYWGFEYIEKQLEKVVEDLHIRDLKELDKMVEEVMSE